MEELKTVEFLHSELCSTIDKLQGLESMLGVIYHSMILNPNSDIWQDNTEKYIDLLSAPYITIIDSIKSIRNEINDIHNRMDDSIITLSTKLTEKESFN